MGELKRANRMLWLFGFFKIPLIGFVQPKILVLTDNDMVVRIKLRRRTRNHLKSMYFGALSIGADLAGAFHAFYLGEKERVKLSIAFKDFHADFIKRPEGDVYFLSNSGSQISDMVKQSVATKERVTQPITVTGVTGYPNDIEVVAEFSLGLSVKYMGKK